MIGDEAILQEWAEDHGGDCHVQPFGADGMKEEAPEIYQAFVWDLQPACDFTLHGFGWTEGEACRNLRLLLKRFRIWWTAEVPQE